MYLNAQEDAALKVFLRIRAHFTWLLMEQAGLRGIAIEICEATGDRTVPTVSERLLKEIAKLSAAEATEVEERVLRPRAISIFSKLRNCFPGARKFKLVFCSLTGVHQVSNTLVNLVPGSEQPVSFVHEVTLLHGAAKTDPWKQRWSFDADVVDPPSEGHWTAVHAGLRLEGCPTFMVWAAQALWNPVKLG